MTPCKRASIAQDVAEYTAAIPEVLAQVHNVSPEVIEEIQKEQTKGVENETV